MSTPVEKINSPDYESAAHIRMQGPGTLVRDVIGGTPKMRAAQEKYLPKEPGEKEAEYQARLKRSVLFNATRKTRDGFVGMVCKEDPKLQNDIKDEVKADLENVDLAGSHFDVFAKEVFTDALTDGHAFILVDMQEALPQGATLEQEKQAGIRPYWVKRTKDQAINFRPAIINGEQVIGQITFEECSMEPDGEYGEKPVTRYRVFRLPVIDDGKDETGIQVRPATHGLVEWEIYRKVKNASGDETIISESSGITSLPRIPVVPVYAKRTGFLESEPPLLDLAYLNIDHYQQNSDYRSQLNKLVPILLRTGLTVEEIKTLGDKLIIGPGALADQPKDTDLKYVSHDGKAIAATREGLIDCEQRMAMAGLSILTQRVESNITATEKRMDQGERTSDLATAARGLKDGLEAALAFHAQYLGVADENGDGGSIELGVAEEQLVIDPQMVSILNQMVTQKRFTLEDLHMYMSGGWDAVDFQNMMTNLKAANLYVGEPPQPDKALFQKGSTKILNGGVQ